MVLDYKETDGKPHKEKSFSSRKLTWYVGYSSCMNKIIWVPPKVKRHAWLALQKALDDG
jgi:hypothetical protein